LKVREYGWKCVSRRAAASPATGFPKAHEQEQGAIVAGAFRGEVLAMKK